MLHYNWLYNRPLPLYNTEGCYIACYEQVLLVYTTCYEQV